MRLDWFGDFFGAIPEALQALYDQGDPSEVGDGWWGFLILAIWGVFFVAIPLVIAKRTYGTHEWVSATMGVVAGLAVFWWVYGILPSAWIYYLDGAKDVLSGDIVPATAGLTFGSGDDAYRLDLASNLYTVIRDLVVVLEHLVAFILTFWAALRIQKAYPRGLGEGEVKPDAGGYK